MNYRVLIADDSEEDVFLLRRTIERTPLRVEVCHELRDGEQVVEYLSGRGPYADRDQYPLPDLLVLDLKMPRLNGLEVLQWFQSHRGQFPATMKVIMLTGSSLERDMQDAKRLHVDGFFTKSANPAELVEFIRGTLCLTAH